MSDILLHRCFGRSRYSGTAAARLWRETFIVAALGVVLGGCSIDLDALSMFPKADKPEVTGSITQPGDVKPAAQLPPAEDMALTRTAVNEVFKRGKNASVPWENRATGARGTVTGIASAYTIDNAQCRDFLASYVAGGRESWLRGEACREGSGSKWEVRALKPWIRS